MANIMDYLAWRGDIALAYSPFNDVDSLVLASLSYLNYPKELFDVFVIADNCTDKSSYLPIIFQRRKSI